MGKTIVDEDMRFNIIVNGNGAQKDLYDLEKATRDLASSNKDLKIQKQKLEAQDKKGSAEWKNLSKQITANNKTIRENHTEMRRLQDQIGITGLTLRQLGQKAAFTKLQMANMLPNDPRRKQLELELKAINLQMGKLSTKAVGVHGALSRTANTFNKYQALAFGVVASLTGIVISMQKMIDYNGKLSDSQADVMKTTGLTKKEVDELTKSFGLLQTRTSRIDLLGIAEQGGRIGIAKNEIGAFVEVMNKAAVSLGDSFQGGAEEVAEKLGKLKFLFAETKDLHVEEAYNKIGSAINELGANGNATEENIADFTQRLGALPEKLKPAIGDALALGAAFEESGVESEIASRAYTIFITSAANNTAKFAQVMGKTKEEVDQLINKDPLEFFLQFSKGLKGMDATDVAKTLNYLSINATGVTKALGAASNNTERFRELMNLSNISMLKGTSILDEYNIKNNNLAATLEKVKKRLIGAFSSETFINALEYAVNLFAKFIGATDDADGSVARFRNALVFFAKILAVVTAAMVTNVAWLKLIALWERRGAEGTILFTLAQKAKVISMNIGIAVSSLYIAVTSLLTGKVKQAAIAMRAFNTTLKTTPWGLILSLVSAVVVAYIAFRKEVKEALTVQKALNDALQKAQEQTAGTVAAMRELQEVVEDESLSQQARLDAMEQLNKIVPDYNANLDLSTEALQRGKIVLDKYVDSLIKQAQAEALIESVKQKNKELQEAQNSSAESYVSWYRKLWIEFNSADMPGSEKQAIYEQGNKQRKERIKILQDEAEAAKGALRAYYDPKEGPQLPGYEKKYDSILYGGDQSIKTERKSDFNVPTDDGDKENKAAEKAADKKKKLIDDLNKDILDANRAAEDAKLALLDDAYLEELAKLKLNHDRKMDVLRAQLIAEQDLQKLPDDLKAKYAAKNEAINKQIEGETQESALKQAELVQKGLSLQLSDLEGKYQREKTLRQTKFAEEITAYEGHDKEQKELQDLQNKEELEAEAKHLKEMVRQFQLIIDQGDFGGFDLSLLTPAQKEQMEKMLEDIKLKLAEVVAEKAKLKGEGESDGLDLGTGGSIDFFGFTAQDWVDTFSNLDTAKEKIAAAGQAVQGFMNAWATYYEYVNANENRKFKEFERNNNAEQNKLKSRLDNGLINQRQYDKGVASLEKEMDKRKADLEFKQAKRAWELQLANAIGTAAMATINGFNSTPFMPVGIIMGSLAATLGTIQVGIIAKNKPVKGYESGYFGTSFPVEREQDGKTFNASYGGEAQSGYYKKPTILVGEMPELILSAPDLKKFNPAVTASIGNEIRRVRGYETGYTSPKVANAESTAAAPLQDNSALVAVLADATAVLRDLKESGLQAYLVRSMEEAKKIQDDLDKLKKFKQKAQV